MATYSVRDIKGITSEVATCDKCGRVLEQAVIVGPLYVGPDCAAKLVQKSRSVVSAAADAAEVRRQRDLSAAKQREADRQAYERRKLDWFQTNYGADNLDTAVEKSGKDWEVVFGEWWAWENSGHS
ncbi:hypothetical protein [Actinacidiphila sp. bgisy167]|uniref:hypothetical protein n=1 Tax=Actinacidiphila sp. bgisy167 TaxID=3413797 RepID=UPI003D742891